MSKDSLGWKEESKKALNEDEKHDEERSLLDPDNDDDIYNKDITKNDNDDKDMRRTSTKPEKPIIDTPVRSKEDEKSGKEEDMLIKQESA